MVYSKTFWGWLGMPIFTSFQNTFISTSMERSSKTTRWLICGSSKIWAQMRRGARLEPWKLIDFAYIMMSWCTVQAALKNMNKASNSQPHLLHKRSQKITSSGSENRFEWNGIELPGRVYRLAKVSDIVDIMNKCLVNSVANSAQLDSTIENRIITYHISPASLHALPTSWDILAQAFGHPSATLLCIFSDLSS